MENLNAEQIRYKMSEKQIKTALMCLSKPNSTPADREKCYFMWKEPSCLSCYHEVAQNALALITSQEQRIKELCEDNEYLKTQLTAIEARYESRKESDIAEMLELRLNVEELTEENERLRGCVKSKEEIEAIMRATYEPLVRTIAKEQIDKAVADTVRKMQSEIQERCIKGGICPAFVKSTIDQIAKEMLEGE